MSGVRTVNPSIDSPRSARNSRKCREISIAWSLVVPKLPTHPSLDGGSPQCWLRFTADQDWYRWRLRFHFKFGCSVKLAFELRPPGLPKCTEELEHLISARTPPVEPLTHDRELLFAPPDADAKFNPSSGQ